MLTLTAQYLSGSRGLFTASTPVLMRPFLVMKWSTRSISCTQRTRTNPRTMMCRAHFWDVSTSFRENRKKCSMFQLFDDFWSLIFPFCQVEKTWYSKENIQNFLFLFLLTVYLAVLVPGGQDKVPQSQIHGGITGKFWELVKLIQLHHIRSHTQSLSTLIRLVEGLVVWTQAWNWGTKSRLLHHIIIILSSLDGRLIKHLPGAWFLFSPNNGCWLLSCSQTYSVAGRLCSDLPSGPSETRCWWSLTDSSPHSRGSRRRGKDSLDSLWTTEAESALNATNCPSPRPPSIRRIRHQVKEEANHHRVLSWSRKEFQNRS